MTMDRYKLFFVWKCCIILLFITDLIQIMLQLDSLLRIMLRRRVRSVWRSSLKSKAILQGHQEGLLFYSQLKIVQQVCIIILCVLLFVCRPRSSDSSSQCYLAIRNRYVTSSEVTSVSKFFAHRFARDLLKAPIALV